VEEELTQADDVGMLAPHQPETLHGRLSGGADVLDVDKLEGETLVVPDVVVPTVTSRLQGAMLPMGGGKLLVGIQGGCIHLSKDPKPSEVPSL